LGTRILDNVIRDLSQVGVVEFRDEGEEKIKSVIITPKAKPSVKGKG
jgi:translation initiation factor IF-3